MKSLQYSIGDLEKITGIKAHTIRMWERRYDLIKPNRTKSNVRMYSQADMEKLQDVVLLYDKGVKISQIAGMCAAERASMLRELGASDDVLELRKDCFTASILEFNEE
ncbi:MAG TPA: MerR family transcriptional regulator, partial [Membranihabitans sp.]|nr:MerR family transcriptional regulator [Membranihabitans sp.]